METAANHHRRNFFVGSLLLTVIGGSVWAVAADRRARPPVYKPDEFKGIFFDDLSEAVRGPRPSVWEMRGAAAAASGAANPAVTASAAAAPASDAQGGWGAMIQPTTLEDEIKRLKLRFDSTIGTPAAFKSGGFQDARRDLTVLASCFAIIAQYPGQVRWKADAAAARDLLARTASNCKAGSAQVYNEAKLRKQDLEDLSSGTGLANRESAPDVEWGAIADRVPLMQYLEELVSEKMKELTASDAAFTAGTDELIRCAELVAVVSEILYGSGMVDAEDTDYRQLTDRMKTAAIAARDAGNRKDAAAARSAVGALGQSCDACHEQYR